MLQRDVRRRIARPIRYPSQCARAAHGPGGSNRKLLILLASPGRIRIHNKKAGHFCVFVAALAQLPPKMPRLRSGFHLDTPAFSWKPTITDRTLLSCYLALTLDS
jgi:hypothetical protein